MGHGILWMAQSWNLMYLRDTTIEKDGKKHTYWRLVRSVRIGKKVRQETVAMLGELDEEGRVQARGMWQRFGGVTGEQLNFFSEVTEAPVALKLSGLRLERGNGALGMYGWGGCCGVD